MFVVGVDKVIEALVDLGIGEVGGEYGDDMTSVGDRVCNGLVGFACIPFPCTEGGQGRDSAIESLKADLTGGEGLTAKTDFVIVVIVQRW